MSFDAKFSKELTFEVFKHFRLVDIIRARGVSRTWREAVLDARPHPVRLRLYKIYLDALDSPAFLQSRPYILGNLAPFDRQGYISTLKHQYARLPESFEMWILEWPERAAFDCFWPGLPFEWDMARDQGVRRRGWNFLANIPPVLYKLDYRYLNLGWQAGETERLLSSFFEGDDIVYIKPPALPIWEGHEGAPGLWLMMDDAPLAAGCVVQLLDRCEHGFDLWRDEGNLRAVPLEPCFTLPFLDWLHLALMRYESGRSEAICELADYDEVSQRWMPRSSETYVRVQETPREDYGGSVDGILSPWVGDMETQNRGRWTDELEHVEDVSYYPERSHADEQEKCCISDI